MIPFFVGEQQQGFFGFTMERYGFTKIKDFGHFILDVAVVY